jgi:hypothetical protein
MKLNRFPLKKWFGMMEAIYDVTIAANYLIPEYENVYGFGIPNMVVQKLSMETRRKKAEENLKRVQVILNRVI